MTGSDSDKAAGSTARRLFVYNGGFLTQRRIRRILELSGYDIKIGKPGADDLIGVWGKSPTSPRGEAVAELTGNPVLRVEDAFLRSIRPGRDGGGPPLGLMIDKRGVHFDASVQSDMEHLLATNPLDDGAVLSRARDGIERLRSLELSKYNHHNMDLAAPEPGYVLVIDQTRGDASVTFGGATESTFREMLVFAQEEHPGARVIIKSHPETVLGHRPGHYNDGHAHGLVSVLTDPVSPWKLLAGAVGVYTVSSHMGFEAILAGHKPRVFGQPFYAGWGLTVDENPVARRERRLTRTQLFAAAMILAPTWYDPCRDKLCSFEDALDALEAQVRTYREDGKGYVASGVRLWKRAHFQKVFGSEHRVLFEKDHARAVEKANATGRKAAVWGVSDTVAGGTTAEGAVRIEDGFLRSRGLGAELVPPLSIVADDLGIYYDPSRPSRLDHLIARGATDHDIRRAERLIGRITRGGLSKYNLSADAVPELPKGYRVLVPGQVEDDASIRLGAGAERTNLALLERARVANPDAVILFKPHPDVEAGLRIGAVDDKSALRFANRVIRHGNPAALIEAVDEVWTMTSTLGFEALLRGKHVVTTGMPFYSGWGLTHDLFPQPAWRKARPTLAAFVHAALIAYPRYFDPVSGLPCPVEVVVDRLIRNDIPVPGAWNRSLSKLQGLFASQSWLWR